MDNNIYIKKEFIQDISVSEIDFDFNDNFGFDYEKHDELIEIEVNNFNDLDGPLIEVDRLISILENVKNKGANYISLEENCDHYGYDILGFNITLATKEDVDKYLNKEKSKSALHKLNKIKRLKQQLKELTEDINDRES